MRRPLISVAFAFLAALVVAVAVAPDPARAADPDAAPYLEAAAEAGLSCSPPIVDSTGGTIWSCRESSFETDRLWGASVDDFEGESFSASINRGWPDPRPAEPEVLALMDRFITITIGEDDAAREWLGRMNDTRISQESLQRGDWRLDWYADWEPPGEGSHAGVQLSISYFPAAPPPPRTPRPADSAAPTAAASGNAECLDEDVIAAIGELDGGNFATDPSLSEIADALDSLDLAGPQDEARDRLVRNLRVRGGDFDLVLAAAMFQSEVVIQE